MKIQLDEVAILNYAKEIYFKRCGFCNMEEERKEQIEESLLILKYILDDMQFKVIGKAFDKYVIHENGLQLEDHFFAWNLPEHIEIKSIQRVYVYMMTVGEDVQKKLEEEHSSLKVTDMLSLLYADMWLTAYLDAARAVLQKYILTEMEEKIGMPLSISESFGPGFYGMPITEINKFFEILDHNLIGVKLSKSGFMFPEKSCVGFYIITNSSKKSILNPCSDCISREGGCTFCSQKK